MTRPPLPPFHRQSAIERFAWLRTAEIAVILLKLPSPTHRIPAGEIGQNF